MSSGEPDEEIPQSGDASERARLRRLRVNLAVGAVVLGAAFLVARAISHNHDPSHAGSSPSPTAPATHRYGTPPDSGSGLLNGMATDGATTQTRAVATVPSAVRAAVLAAFPGAGRVGVSTLYLPGRPDGLLSFRQITATVADAALSVSLQGPAPNDAPSPGSGQTGSSSYYNGLLQDYFVSADLARPGELAALSRLARDPRLLTPG